MDVKTLCLAVLFQGEATGYEIKKAFEEGPFAHFQRASFGSIYPSLSRLLAEGLAEAEAHEQDGRPDKKVYRLTAAGREAFDDDTRGVVALRIGEGVAAAARRVLGEAIGPIWLGESRAA